MSDTRQQAQRAKAAYFRLQTMDRTAILHDLAEALRAHSADIFTANAQDLAAAKDTLSKPLYKRLVLDEPKLRDVIDGIEQIAAMDDPVGRVLEETELDDGLLLKKVKTPIGVIAAIFESRPDVVPQIAALALRSGNTVLLKGGREAAHTNAALGNVIQDALRSHGIADAVQLVSTREEVAELLGMDDLIGLVVPRGSNEMVRSIQERTKIPVLGHADGICHVFIDESADLEKAVRIAIDSKTSAPSACNAAETLLIHRRFSQIDKLLGSLKKAGVDLRMESDFGHEFLDLILSVHIVNGLDDAMDHIRRYGSSHTDSIVTEDAANAQRFLREVDSAGVYWNASTHFADGYRYGLGAEVGISTNRTHARGPVGIDGLMIYKYQLIGDGHIAATYKGQNARPFTHRRRI
jgi:glutamate-5-semialdehyde dehydrogenase